MPPTQPSFSPPVRIVTSRRRRRTVAARLRAGVLEVMVPAAFLTFLLVYMTALGVNRLFNL